MPAKIQDSQRSNAIELYVSGQSIKRIAATIGASDGWVGGVVRQAGVSRSRGDARRLHFANGGLPSRFRDDVPIGDLIARYIAGESANALASAYGASNDFVHTKLRAAGVSVRPIADAAPLRNYNQMTAKTAKSQSRKIGFGESQITEWLTDRGEVPERQVACGPYNLDIAVGPVAVEVQTLGVNPFCYSRLRKRNEYLRDRGWTLVFLLISSRTRVLIPAAADQVICAIEAARSNPTAPRQHRVIRGCGELAAVVGDDFNYPALIRPSMACPYHGT
jgi:hypothetical protein